jgi:hypothetical protein
MTAVIAAVVLVGVYALAQLFVARDDAKVAGAERGPGTLEPDRGAAHRENAAPREPPLPTSGPHAPDLVTRDAQVLSPDQVLHALELGNVVLLYDGARPPAALRALQEELSGAFDAELAAAGQAVILAAGGDGRTEALAWRRRLRASGPDDPALREFAEAWLGKGALGRR